MQPSFAPTALPSRSNQGLSRRASRFRWAPFTFLPLTSTTPSVFGSVFFKFVLIIGFGFIFLSAGGLFAGPKKKSPGTVQDSIDLTLCVDRSSHFQASNPKVRNPESNQNQGTILRPPGAGTKPDGQIPQDNVETKILSIADRAVITFRSMVKQILWVAVPIAAFALVFHFLETFVLQRLVERFGWNAALWTGWIGTPIHESSHALLCVVFQHKIEKMALFQPDLQERRLGFVRHTYTKGKLWQEIGNFFIGLAPLAGGTLALLLFSWMLYPQLVQPFLFSQQPAHLSPPAVSGPPTVSAPELNILHKSQQEITPEINQKESLSPNTPSEGGFSDLSLTMAHQFGTLFTFSNLISWRFWLFLYLVTCVTVHMAPSSSDYLGAKQGGLILLAFWLAAHLVHGLLGMSMESWGSVFWPLWFHVLGVLILSTGLGLLVMGVVFVFTEVWDIATGRNH